jgi:hypothetical protein
MKNIFIYTFLTLLNFVINFSIYNYSFNKQATPYLDEEQRVDSGLIMLKTTFPAYILAAILITLLFFLAAKYSITSLSKGRS